jgi:hypothetical protein
MTTRNYWLDPFTGVTWKEFLAAGGDVSGFRESRWAAAPAAPTLRTLLPPQIATVRAPAWFRHIQAAFGTADLNTETIEC